MKYLFTLLTIICFQDVYAQSVYTVKYESQADVKVYVVDYESQADLLVFKQKYESNADGNEGNWYFSDYESQADKTIFFVDYESQADLKIYFVDYESRAGWKNSGKKHLMYQRKCCVGRMLKVESRKSFFLLLSTFYRITQTTPLPPLQSFRREPILFCSLFARCLCCISKG